MDNLLRLKVDTQMLVLNSYFGVRKVELNF